MTTAGQYMLTLQSRRRENLARLASKEQSQAAFARKAHMGKDHINTLIRGKRSFTEVTARRIEQFLGLPFGTLDLGEGR